MIQVVVRALEILEYVNKKENDPTTLTELAAAVGLNQPTCANIVKTLVEKKYFRLTSDWRVRLNVAGYNAKKRMRFFLSS